MDFEGAGGRDWTARVESAVSEEILRRGRWMRAYLALVLLLTISTLALVWFARRDDSDRIRRQVQPVAAATERLQGQQVDLARHQIDLAERLTRLETEVGDLAREIVGPSAAAPVKAPAPAVPPAALARLTAQQTRLGHAVSDIDQRLRQVELATAPAAGSPPPPAGSTVDATIDARLARMEAVLAALEKAPAAAPAPRPDGAAQRLAALEHRLSRLERTAVRSGAADAD
jgi:hypothetical protein